MDDCVLLSFVDGMSRVKISSADTKSMMKLELYLKFRKFLFVKNYRLYKNTESEDFGVDTRELITRKLV